MRDHGTSLPGIDLARALRAYPSVGLGAPIGNHRISRFASATGIFCLQRRRTPVLRPNSRARMLCTDAPGTEFSFPSHLGDDLLILGDYGFRSVYR
ncbi:MAG: hypothetical protein WBQ34_07210 [Candidatus Acidiferrales bacterium]